LKTLAAERPFEHRVLVAGDRFGVVRLVNDVIQLTGIPDEVVELPPDWLTGVFVEPHNELVVLGPHHEGVHRRGSTLGFRSSEMANSVPAKLSLSRSSE